jgi:hypothetical protein
MLSKPFERFAGLSAILLGIGGFVYAAVFAYIVAANAPAGVRELWFGILLLGGILSTVAWVALYQILKETEASVAVLALALGLMGSLGGVLHGAANLNRTMQAPGAGQPEFPLDPRGILRYGVAGLALLLIGWLILRGGSFPRWVGLIAYAGGAVLVFIYIGRLYDFITPETKATLIPPFLFGFVLYPALFIGIGLRLLQVATPRSLGPP